jgi:hypothetical protein
MADADTRAALVAAIGAGVTVATHVAGIAARDASFLAYYDITELPVMAIGAALTTIFAVMLSTRAMASLGPSRLVPALFFVSAATFVGERWFIDTHARIVVVTLYLQMTALGAILISGFWSLVSERFDPRTAKRFMGRMMGGATMGGLFGGVLAAQVAQFATLESILPMLAGLHVVAGVLVFFLRAPKDTTALAEADDEEVSSGLRLLARTPYLRDLAGLVLLGSIATAAIDYVFKAEAAHQYGDGDALLLFFGYFYAVQGALTFGIQTTLAKGMLRRLGLGPTLATHPVVVAIGSATALLMPGLWPMAGARVGAAAVRRSLFRSAYELLFTASSARETRATKTIIDVGCDGVGDAVGAGMVRGIIALAPTVANRVLLAIAVGLSFFLVLLVNRLRRGYVQTLEKSMMARAAQLHIPNHTIADAQTRAVLLSTASSLAGGSFATAALRRFPDSEADEEELEARDAEFDPIGDRILALRSRDPLKVRTALQLGPLAPPLIPLTLELLGHSSTAGAAKAALLEIAEEHCGQFLDALLSPETDPVVRRQLPKLIAGAGTERAMGCLVAAMVSEDFSTRYQSGRAAARLGDDKPDLRPSKETVLALIASEVAVDRDAWLASASLPGARAQAHDDDFGSAQLRKPANRRLEHVFRLLSLVLPRDALRVAYRSLHSGDKQLRGTALEYLEGALPAEIRKQLWPFLEGDA